jgi:VWFA-related protein
MRRLVLLLLLAQVVLPARAVKRVSVEQLERTLRGFRGKPDSKVAGFLSELQLTERLGAIRLAYWEANLPGPQSRRSLLILSDLSAFLDPPAGQILQIAVPDLNTQRNIMAMAVEYATKSMRQLPNFLAVKDTIHFEDSPAHHRYEGGADFRFYPYQPLRPVSRSSATVPYRDGEEVVNSESSNSGETNIHGLNTSGEFGQILGTVLVDSADSRLLWSHWEGGPNEHKAVFRFTVPRQNSHYQVQYCCVADYKGIHVFRDFTGYHGEITINPANGTILRLTLIADLEKADPIVRSDILVEYGPVEIGGKIYFCPLKSISVSVAPEQFQKTSATERVESLTSQQLKRAARTQNLEGFSPDQESKAPRPLQMMLNEEVFDRYHLFRADMRILPSDKDEQPAAPTSNTISDANTADLQASVAEAKEKSGATDISSGAATAHEQPVRSSPSVPAEIPPSASPTPEISATSSAEVSDIPQAPTSAAPPRNYTLRVTARSVDVSVVARDKKGHPVTNLKPEDFELYDNGRKQSVRFFSPARGASVNGSTPLLEQLNESVYSNHRVDAVSEKSNTESEQSNVTILLIDADSLAWADLTYAREQLLKFLRELPPDARVGLYVQKSSGFQILAAETESHESVLTALSRWMPSAQGLAQAQETEQRNREQFDEVLHQEDLQSVNGNAATPFTATMVDPQLRDLRSNPRVAAMFSLVGLARHLAAIPGHKNLIWIASDNVLVNWSDKAVGPGIGDKNIDSAVMRAQEAMNDAHISLYPLSASHLEAAAIDPSLANASVELSPSVTAPSPPQMGSAMPGLGRATAEMQQDMHPIQPAIQEMARATGGLIFRRSGDIAANLKRAVEDGTSTYLLGFTPDIPADDRYHQLVVKVVTRRGISLRYRTGYLYAKEPSTLKDRFHRAIWQPLDSSEISLSARLAEATNGTALKLNIATSDVDLVKEGDLWKDKLDIFLLLRNDSVQAARVTEQTLSLAVKPANLQELLRNGIPFEQFVPRDNKASSIRIVVVDETSGRIGSLTLPAEFFNTRTEQQK